VEWVLPAVWPVRVEVGGDLLNLMLSAREYHLAQAPAVYEAVAGGADGTRTGISRSWKASRTPATSQYATDAALDASGHGCRVELAGAPTGASSQ
jgi:hypothetical protein